MKRSTPLLLALLLGSLTACKDQARLPRTLSVNGEGYVQTVPDQVELSIGIESADVNVKTAKAQGDEVMAKILKVTKELKIEDKDVQSDYVRIDSEYSPIPEDRMRVIRFVARRTVKILLRDINQYDRLTSRLFDEGANLLSDIAFRSSKKTDFENHARMLAIENAKLKAESMAKALGCKVGKALEIRDGSAPETSLGVPRFTQAKMMNADAGAPLAAGQIMIHSEVGIVFEIE